MNSSSAVGSFQYYWPSLHLMQLGSGQTSLRGGYIEDRLRYKENICPNPPTSILEARLAVYMRLDQPNPVNILVLDNTKRDHKYKYHELLVYNEAYPTALLIPCTQIGLFILTSPIFVSCLFSASQGSRHVAAGKSQWIDECQAKLLDQEPRSTCC